jgi:hypothetical protein
MALQTNYPGAVPVAYAGMVANGETSNRISRTVEDAAGIAWGVPVWRGTGDHGVTATPTAGTLMGITIANYASPPVQTTGAESNSYPQNSTAGIMTQGVMWVTAGANTTDGAQAYATSAGVITPTSTSNTIMPGWFFDDTVSSGALVRIAKR